MGAAGGPPNGARCAAKAEGAAAQRKRAPNAGGVGVAEQLSGEPSRGSASSAAPSPPGWAAAEGAAAGADARVGHRYPTRGAADSRWRSPRNRADRSWATRGATRRRSAPWCRRNALWTPDGSLSPAPKFKPGRKVLRDAASRAAQRHSFGATASVTWSHTTPLTRQETSLLLPHSGLPGRLRPAKPLPPGQLRKVEPQTGAAPY